MTFEDDLVISLWLNSTRSVWSHFISDLLAGWLFQVDFISKQRPPNIWGDLKCIGRETLYSEQQILKSSKVFIERIGSHVGFISLYNPQKKYFQYCVFYLSRNQPFKLSQNQVRNCLALFAEVEKLIKYIVLYWTT